MTYDTINDAQTVAGNGEGTFLVGRYRVVRQLGAGGMGSVWLAEDTQLDNKQFAIKMLPTILVSNKRAYRQLKDEALVAMKLTHPNIVTLRAFEENNGNPFLVMDYIDGQTLDDYLADHDNRVEMVGRGDPTAPDGSRGSPLPAENGRAGAPRTPQGGLPEAYVLRILKPIAAALDYAHSKGVVHRDVKPGNVMIAKDGTPYILDFGIAREIQETLTRVTGKLSSGTLLYMSPEQLHGAVPRKEQDIYSFAAMAYECLKGEPPFVRGQIEHQIDNDKPEPLVSVVADPMVGRGDPTAPLAAGVMSGLAKKPEDRPPTCAAVLEGEGFSHKEHKDLKVVGRGDPTAPQTVTGFNRAEHVERAETVGRGDPTAPRTDTAGRAGSPLPAKNGRAGAPRTPQGGTRIGAAMKALAVALVLAGGYFGWMKYDESVKSREAEAVRQKVAAEEAKRKAGEAARQKAAAEEARRKAEEAARQKAAVETAERIAKASATEMRIEAKIQQGMVTRISDTDGFKARKDQLEDVFIRAEAFYDENAKRWAEAKTLYKDYIEQSKSLITFDGERQLAVAKRSEVQASFKKAEEAGAKTYAKDSWNAAVKTWNAAAAEFTRMEFVAAAETFAKVLREFDECAIEARNNKQIADEKLAEEKRLAEARAAEERRRAAELARQAEDRRRQEERRKALQSLPGKWKCQITQKTSYYNLPFQYEYEFRNGGDYIETMTTWSPGYESQKTVTTMTGIWHLSGNTLTLRCPSWSTTLPGGSVRVEKNPFKKSCDYRVLWKNDGSFELRFADSHPFEEEKGVEKTVSYDYQGNQTIHIKSEGGFLRPSREYDIIQTAKIFRRVSN